jgi:hypothetical protein
MALKLVTPLQNTFPRDVDATDVFDNSLAVVDGGIVAISDTDGVTDGIASVGVAVSDTPASGETQVVAGSSVTHTLALSVGAGGGHNARIVFNGTDRKDTEELKQLTILEGSGFVVETDQCVAKTYAPGDWLTVEVSGANRGKLTNDITATEAGSGISAVVTPIVAVVDSIVDQATNVLNIKWL